MSTLAEKLETPHTTTGPARCTGFYARGKVFACVRRAHAFARASRVTE